MDDWYRLRKITPEKLALARQVLEEVRRGADAYRALRRHPLPGGGYLGKDVLVAAYRRLVESGEWQARGLPGQGCAGGCLPQAGGIR